MGTQVVRLNEDGSLDEIVITDCTFHLEQMDDTAWWIGIDRGDGPERVSLDINLTTKRATIHAIWEDEGLHPTVETPQWPPASKTE